MKESQDIFQMINEIGENGKVKARCCLMIEKRFEDTELSPKIQKLVYVQNASAKVSQTSDFAVVDLSFENCTDYDYLRTLELCREFTEMTDACEFVEKSNSDLSLILYMTPNGNYDCFLMGMDATWKLIPKKLEGRRSAIQLIFAKEKLGSYELS